MKKLVFLTLLLFQFTTSFSQTDNYQGKMKELIAKIDSYNDAETLTNLAITFEQVGDAEQTQWLPYYYGAYFTLMAANMKTMGQQNASITDPAADKAEVLLNKALALTKENSEIFCIKKMVATMRMMGDPMNRYLQYGLASSEALERAKEMNPDNPRVYLLEGQDKFYTPEQFGGSKAEAKVLFEKAQQLFNTFEPETELHPTWGKPTVQYFLTELK